VKTELLEQLRCPNTNQRLVVESDGPETGVIENGFLVSADGRHRYPIRNGIARFVPESNYADNFGMQWNQFRKTQLDSFSGHPISAERFWTTTGWRSEELKGQWVLDVGCGAGRFAEVALRAGAKVVAVDLSSAVDACYANLRYYDGLHVVQADIYRLPFVAASFAFVYSLGVLQHTPVVAKAFHALPPLVRPGGKLCVDYYPKSWKTVFTPYYWLRAITKRVPKATLFSALKRAVPVMLPVSRFLGAVPGAGFVLKRLVPVMDYHGELPLSEQQRQEWALLDTFDVFAPAYDQPQTIATARKWMESAGLKGIEVFRAGHLVARGRK